LSKKLVKYFSYYRVLEGTVSARALNGITLTFVSCRWSRIAQSIAFNRQQQVMVFAGSVGGGKYCISPK
jgi:hypothetical protein